MEERSWASSDLQRLFSHPGIRVSPPLNSLLSFSFSFFPFFFIVFQQIEYKVRGYAITVKSPWSRIQHFDIFGLLLEAADELLSVSFRICSRGIFNRLIFCWKEELILCLIYVFVFKKYEHTYV